MSEAEKKWRERADKDCKSFIHGICDTYHMGREAYKAALKREIEKRNKDNDYLYQWTTNEIIELLDTVEP